MCSQVEELLGRTWRERFPFQSTCRKIREELIRNFSFHYRNMEINKEEDRDVDWYECRWSMVDTE
jgi:hypothetical protein